MDVQDYDYYEARAKDVKLENITSSQQNADILERLRDNDPYFTSIFISDESDYDENGFVVREGDNLGWLGYFVGRSKQLEGLYIDNFPDNLNIDAFLRGLGYNRSIESLTIYTDLGRSFKSLVPFLRNNSSLRDLTLIGFNIELQCARNIASLLGQQSSLKCLSFEEADLRDEGLLKIAATLSTQPQIQELNFYANNIGRNGSVALGNVLEELRNPNLATLDLGYNDIDDEGLHALVAGLINCRNLTSFCLSDNELITEAGLKSLSALFQSDHCRLECLDLDGLNMDNDGVAVLSTGLASLPTLKKLDLSSNRIGDQGLQALVGLVNCCNIEDLSFARNVLAVSVSGLRSLGEIVQRATRLKSLNLRSNAINDEGLQALADGMTTRCSLTKLDFAYNHSITAVGLRSLAPFFRSDNCCLVELGLWGINFVDDGAAALADGLMGNESLTKLYFTLFSSYGLAMTARGWAAFSKLLCDTASVNNTYLSNHTLVAIGECSMDGTPPDILEYLTFNKMQSCDAAICKILDSHPDIDIKPLFHWNLKCLPLVVRWLEKAKPYLGYVNESTGTFQCRQLSALYKFVRGMPLLTVDGYRGKEMKEIESKSKKRKFDLTL
ncbi:leucine-rich repeat protein [Skeletonema marinoi]|uniref:Leucine-rich repeat protein n=1 Tax=Skeletonema marinoi TaxID=267567 RepID=A0AAD8XVD5_9STRA|nr:leucine-rich repeat protein [Skeletonema marinoi]